MEIQSINTKCLFPHPMNPRKDFGDLTDLTASVKAKGIMQPLTVIKGYVGHKGEISNAPGHSNSYTIIAGHRRLRAANNAFRNEVPCIVVDVPLKEQIEMMLLENIQRSSLTPVEEAQGFQMMLDMGEDYGGIAKATGISESTIRRRVELLDYDQDDLEKAMERGARLEDFAALREISDPAARAEVLKAAGTPDFKMRLTTAKTEQKRLFHMEACRKELLEAGIEEIILAEGKNVFADLPHLRYVTNLRFYGAADKHTAAEAQVEGYSGTIYFKFGKYQIDIYNEKENGSASEPAVNQQSGVTSHPNATYAAQQEAAAARAEAEREAQTQLAGRKDEINVIWNNAMRCRIDFIREKGVPTVQNRTVVKFAMDVMARIAIDYDFGETPEYALLETLIELEDVKIEDKQQAIHAALNAVPNDYRKLLLMAAAITEANLEYDYSLYDYSLNRRDDIPIATAYYAFLESIGYQVSSDERSILDGTNPLFSNAAAIQEGDDNG